MAIDLVSDPGGLFPRIGRILHVAYLLTPYEAALPAAFVDIFDQYLATLQPVGGAVEVSANNQVRAASGVMSFAPQAAQNTITGMVLADQPSQARSFQAAMNEVIRQMTAQSKTVLANTITITPAQLTTPTFVGTGVLVTSTKRGDGLVQENSVAETLRLVCTADSYTGGRTAGQELFGLTGAAQTAGVWDYDYPTGSGANAQVTAISAEINGNSNSNTLTNGDFSDWSDDPAPELDNWTLETGTWGTDIQQDDTNPLGDREFCVEFLPGTGVNTKLYQAFGDASAGTPVTPDGLRSYAVNVWLRRVGSVSGGVLTVELVDDSGTVLNDEQGVANSFTVTCSSLTTAYVAYNQVFRLNNTPPTAIWLRFRMSTALTGGSVLMADAAYPPLTAMYAGGPAFCVFSNAAVPFVSGDAWNIAVTNNQGGASYLGTFQTGFDRLFGMKQLGLLLPSSATPNINNTLITA